MRRRTLRLTAVVVAALTLTGARLPAQIWAGSQPRDTTYLRPELRVDYIGAREHALHVGAGLSLPAGRYARLGFAAGAGPGWGDGSYPSARIDGVVRFLVDPFRRSRLGFSAGGGLSARYDEHLRGVALLFAEVEGPGARGWIPFGGVGLGGGVRLSAGLRRAATTGR